MRSAVDGYQNHLQYVLEHLNKEDDGSNNDTNINEQQHSIKKEKSNSSDPFHNIHPCPEKCANTHKLLSPQILARAIRALTRCKMDTPLLSKRIRDIERLVGKIGWTPITDDLSYRLLEANGKAGNVKRTLALLELRRTRGYAPREEERLDSTTASSFIQPGEKEFIHAITSIQSAQLPLRRSRNIYLHESSFSESSLDNPTRYLDAILINMSQRGVSLTPAMAARMLNCYASTGRTGRALHYFYKVVRDPVEEDGVYIPGPHPTHLGKEEMEMWKAEKRGEGVGRALSVALEVSQEKEDKELDVMASDANNGGMPENGNIKNKVRMIMHSAPPFHKIPGLVKGAPLIQNRDHMPFSFEGASSKAAASSPTTDKSSSSSSVNTTKPQGAVNPYDRKAKSMTKFEWEMERDWSLSLTAAFAFADSLTHGACGHQPIELNLGGWNALIKACCYRGAFHRALKILNETMPQKGIEPDSFSYNTILAGLARVVSFSYESSNHLWHLCWFKQLSSLFSFFIIFKQGDIASLKEYLIGMTNKQVLVDKFTVQVRKTGTLVWFVTF